MKTRKINNILIIRPDAIGDFVNITPVLKAIKANNPDIKITLLASKNNSPLASNHPLIDETIVDKIKAGQINSISDFFDYVKEIREKKFDAALIFYNELPYALLAFFARIPFRVGDKDKLLLSPFYNSGVHIKNVDQSKTVIDYNLLYIKCLGFTYENPAPNLPPPRKDFPIFGNPLIGIHMGYIGGTGARRKLPKEKYLESINQIANLVPGAKIALLGIDDMADDADYITAHSTAGASLINLVGKTDLDELMSVISKLNVYIGVDTGPTHIAAAYKIPMVFIMAIKSVKPLRWAPNHSPKVIVKLKSRCPHVCNYASCKETVCSDSISTDEIAEGVKLLLNKKESSYQDEYRYSFKMSNNILFVSDQMPRIASKLSQQGFGAAHLPINKFTIFNLKNILDLMLYEDITIVHSEKNDQILFKLLEWISPSLLLTPPLILFDDRNWGSADELIKYYIERFKAKTHV
jgi:ADP-heptose:LPS heptosyltransferase